MPTIAAGAVATVYCPLAGSITITPGSAGAASFQARDNNGGQSSAPRVIYAAESVAVAAGDTVSIQAIGSAATYTTPAGGNTAVADLVSGDAKNRALRAWRSQTKTYKLAAIPEPTIFIDSIRGLDTNAGTKALPYQTINKLLTALPAAGACVALANDSLFDLTDQIIFSAASSTQINGTNDATRVTFTNYDPGGAPTSRPRIRFRFLPTAGNWTWDATVQAWYYTHPSSRSWGSYTGMARMAGRWGNNRSVNNPPFVAGLLSKDGDFYANDTNKRMYVYAPQATDPTTYYGGPGSVILGEGERAAINFNRCANFVTWDNIIFEDCGLGLQYMNLGAVANLAGLVVQRCQFLNCGRGWANVSESASAFTMSASVLENTFRNMGTFGVHCLQKNTETDVAGNFFSGVNLSSSQGGAIYCQGDSGGVQTMARNRVFENYIEDAKFNRGNCPYDGAGIYFEARARGWYCFKNFITRAHYGILNNTGMPLTLQFNVMDDCDLPYAVADGSSVNTVNSVFEHNTAINCGITKYRTGDSLIDPVNRRELNPLRATVGVFDGLTTAAIFTHRNNVIHLAADAPAVAGMEVYRNSTIDASGNHFVGNFTGLVQTHQFGFTPTVLSPAETTSAASASFGLMYEPLTGVPAAPVLSTLPAPVDAYGYAAVGGKKGAVSL